MEKNSKFHFTDAEILAAAKAERLLSLEIEFSRKCNYRCPYCYEGEPDFSDEMPLDLIYSVIDQAAELGARKIVILGGEPLMYPDLVSCLDRIKSLDMVAEIFTNGALINRELLDSIQKYECKFAVKLNSLDPIVQQKMIGYPNGNVLARVMGAIELLMEYGYAKEQRLAISSVICKDNLGDIEPLWKWARARNIEPYFEMMTPQGRLLENQELLVDPMVIKELFESLSRYDNSLGYEWEPQVPLAGAKCLRHLYSALVKANGEVTPCVGVTAVMGSVKERSLQYILNSSGMHRDFLNYRKMIKEPCASCEKSELCYGCRGAAYQLTGDYLAADPLCWRNKGCKDITFLPCSAEEMIPHQEPIRMVKSIVATGHENVAVVHIPYGHPLSDDQGFLTQESTLELTAQAGAATDAFRHSGAVAAGLLVGGRGVEFFVPIPIEVDLKVKIVEKDIFEQYHIVDFVVCSMDEKITYARGELTLCVYR